MKINKYLYTEDNVQLSFEFHEKGEEESKKEKTIFIRLMEQAISDLRKEL